MEFKDTVGEEACREAQDEGDSDGVEHQTLPNGEQGEVLTICTRSEELYSLCSCEYTCSAVILSRMDAPTTGNNNIQNSLAA